MKSPSSNTKPISSSVVKTIKKSINPAQKHVLHLHKWLAIVVQMMEELNRTENNMGDPDIHSMFSEFGGDRDYINKCILRYKLDAINAA